MTDTELRAITQDLNQRDLLEPLQRIAKAHHVSVHEVLDDKVRFRPAQHAAREFWFELREVHGWNSVNIARVLRRNVETVRWGLKALRQRDAKASRGGSDHRGDGPDSRQEESTAGISNSVDAGVSGRTINVPPPHAREGNDLAKGGIR